MSLPPTHEPLARAADATPEWLTAVLHAGGHLENPETAVARVRVDEAQSQNGATARLQLSYSGDTNSPIRPPRLFLKVCDRATVELFGDSEVSYYRDLCGGIPPLPAPRCFHSAFSTACGYHLLLEDLSETHISAHEHAPTLHSARLAVDAMALLHARWWDAPDLPAVARRMPTGHVVQRYVRAAEPGLEPMVKACVADLSPRERDLVRRVFEKHPALMARRGGEGSARHLTCIHADPNPGNILIPRTPKGATGERAYLIDRQLFDWSLSAWVGPSDLAYMMVHWWEPEVRRSLEGPLLEQYHRRLEELGVRGYSLPDVWDDYRLSAMQSLYVAANWCVDPAEREAFGWVWRPQLRKTLIALDDLQCVDLLG